MVLFRVWYLVSCLCVKTTAKWWVGVKEMKWKVGVLNSLIFILHFFNLDSWLLILDSSFYQSWSFILHSWILHLNSWIESWILTLDSWILNLHSWIFILEYWIFILESWIFILDSRFFILDFRYSRFSNLDSGFSIPDFLF